MPRPTLTSGTKPGEAAVDNQLTRDFTEQEIDEFKDAFAMFDVDGGGTIESHELREVITQLAGENPSDEVRPCRRLKASGLTQKGVSILVLFRALPGKLTNIFSWLIKITGNSRND
jgi:hypothetical protein